jgi:hypothetical protein
MSDETFLQTVAGHAPGPYAFHHRDHLRLAWLLIRQQGVEQAGHSVAATIRTFATQHGQPDKYHETITQFWIRLVGHLIQIRPDIVDFATFMETFPHLLDTGLPGSERRYAATRRGSPGLSQICFHWHSKPAAPRDNRDTM